MGKRKGFPLTGPDTLQVVELPSAAVAGVGGKTPMADAQVRETVGRILAAKAKRMSPHTRRAYGADIKDFLAFCKLPTIAAFLSRDGLWANMKAWEFVSHLEASGFARRTIQRKVSSLKALVKQVAALGVIPWTLDVTVSKSSYIAVSERTQKRALGISEVLGLEATLKAAAGAEKPSPAALRDLVVFYLLAENALRRKEVGTIRLADMQLSRHRVFITGKMRVEQEPIILSPRGLAAVEAWTPYCPGDWLVPSLSRNSYGKPLSGDGVYMLVRSWDKHLGGAGRLHPHLFRHFVITRALEATGGDLPRVQRLARHKNPATTMAYDDREKVSDLAAAILDRRE